MYANDPTLRPDRSHRTAIAVATLLAASTFGMPGIPGAPTFNGSLDEGRTGMPVTRLVVDGDTLRAELGYASVTIEGTLDSSRSTLAGQWRQGPGKLPLTLRKGAVAEDDATADATDTAGTDAFPPAGAESVGIPERSLDILADRIRALVENDDIVGGELVVIQGRRTVFREAFGWRDREADDRLETGALYCVRSMTKPLVGTAIQMLIDDGRLALDTPVHEILPFFDGPRTGKITVEHLLTHTGGFPFTTLTRPLREYDDLIDVAREVAATELLFEPGARFEYSDGGSDTLGAIVATITGEPVERFIQDRILDPLDMDDSVVLLGEDASVRERIPAAYSGGTGAWSKHWEPTDPAIYPFFLTSQSLYSTTTDYAKFLALWLDGGKVGDRRLLSADAVRRGLTPNRTIDIYPGGFGETKPFYGQQWVLYAEPGDASPGAVEVFGHSGSDGTYAWAWPERDLMVLFFTQSRGSLAGVNLERILQAALIDRAFDDPVLAVHDVDPAKLEDVAGIYWDAERPETYTVVRPLGERLLVERPGNRQLVFLPTRTPDRYALEIRDDAWIEFVRSDEGEVVGMRDARAAEGDLDPRHVPQEGLPSVEDVIASVRRAHAIDRIDEVGTVSMSGTVTIESRGMEGALTTWLDGTRQRTDVRFGDTVESVGVDGERAWRHTVDGGTDELEGVMREQASLGRTVVLYGDWTAHYASVEVLKRARLEDRSVFVVRLVPHEAPGSTVFVDEATGVILRTDALTQIPGLGIVGVRAYYGDFRDVGGMRLPFESKARYANRFLGKVITRFESAETGLDMPEDAFSPPRE